MSEIRELAMRLAEEAGFAVDEFGGFVGGEEHMESIIRAAMREGMTRAAQIAENEKPGMTFTPMMVVETIDGVVSAIRAEAAKLEGK